MAKYLRSCDGGCSSPTFSPAFFREPPSHISPGESRKVVEPFLSEGAAREMGPTAGPQEQEPAESGNHQSEAEENRPGGHAQSGPGLHRAREKVGGADGDFRRRGERRGLLLCGTATPGEGKRAQHGPTSGEVRARPESPDAVRRERGVGGGRPGE